MRSPSISNRSAELLGHVSCSIPPAQHPQRLQRYPLRWFALAGIGDRPDDAVERSALQPTPVGLPLGSDQIDRVCHSRIGRCAIVLGCGSEVVERSQRRVLMPRMRDEVLDPCTDRFPRRLSFSCRNRTLCSPCGARRTACAQRAFNACWSPVAEIDRRFHVGFPGVALGIRQASRAAGCRVHHHDGGRRSRVHNRTVG